MMKALDYSLDIFDPSPIFAIFNQNFLFKFTEFWLFFSSFIKNGQNQQKILCQPYDFFLFLSLEMSILGQKAFKNAFYKKYSIQGKKVKKTIFLRKSSLLKIRTWNVYNQSLENQQVNLIASAKLRSLSVQFFNSLEIIKNKL